MQTALAPSGTFVLTGSNAPQRRSPRAVRLACRAQGGLNTPTSLIGCHSQVWVGGWEKQDIIKSVEGTKNAGFDLIEGIDAFAAVTADQRCRPRLEQASRTGTSHCADLILLQRLQRVCKIPPTEGGPLLHWHLHASG